MKRIFKKNSLERTLKRFPSEINANQSSMKNLFVGLFAMVFIAGSLGMVIAVDPVLTVTSPTNGAFLDSRTVTVDASADQNVSFNLFRNVLRSRRAVELCDNVMTCMDTFRAREGSNTIRVKVLNTDGESDSEDISFTVDTRAPRISRTEPRNNQWINAADSFVVNYREVNLENITLHYSNGTESRTMTKSDCTSGSKQACSFMPDLTDFNGQDILYHFELVDKANNNASSQIRTVNVDLTLPVIDSASYTVEGRRVTFSVAVEEENFDRVLIKDNNSRRPRWIRLCSRLNVGVCTKTKTFREGTHQIDVRVLDEAGNSVDQSLSAFVI